MAFLADLHVHSYLSRATSPRMRLGPMRAGARIKGISLLGTGDFTHPAWFAQLSERLEPAEPGLFRLADDSADDVIIPSVPASCQRDVRFILSCEISCIYKRGGRTRKVHNLVLMPDLKAVADFNSALSRVGNIRSDGRPILGLDSEDLLKMVLDASGSGMLIPAHIWTPHFSVFGSASAFSSLEECFGDLAGHIRAVETGLSSDPPMNWRLCGLDDLTLVSNSDAHSPEKLGREANVLDCEMSYDGVLNAISTGEGFLGTIEFFPQEGKYHLDGHRACDECLTPGQTRENGFRCPSCGRKITVGVVHRIEELADRDQGVRPPGARPFESIIPLREILSEILKTGPNTKKVTAAYDRLVAEAGGELPVLRTHSVEDLADISGQTLAEAVRRMRAGEVLIEPGFDGRYGRIRLFSLGELEALDGQGKLFKT